MPPDFQKIFPSTDFLLLTSWTWTGASPIRHSCAHGGRHRVAALHALRAKRRGRGCIAPQRGASPDPQRSRQPSVNRAAAPRARRCISQPSMLQGSTYDHPTRRRDRQLPALPALQPFLQASWSAPATARAPVAAYNPFTQAVEGIQRREPPPMGNVLATHLAPGTAGTGTTKSPQLPGKQERGLARQTTQFAC